MSQQKPVGGNGMPLLSLSDMLGGQGRELAQRLGQVRSDRAVKTPVRTLRSFSLGETANYLGLSPSNLKKLHREGKGPSPAVLPNGRRTYSAEAISGLRLYLDRNGRTGAKRYWPHRRGAEPLQVISLVNFRAGTGKTTVAAHLAQYLALTGHRVLAVDLDPQAHLSALFGFDTDASERATICEALRCGPDKRRLADIIKPTHFPDLDIVPASIELEAFALHAGVRSKAGESKGLPPWQNLSQVLSQADAGYDIVIIDTPPQLGDLTISAICVATGVLVAVHPHISDLASTSRFLMALGETLSPGPQEVDAAPPKWIRYLITRHDPDDINQVRYIGLLQSVLAGQMIARPMRETAALAVAMASGKSLYEIEHSGPQRFEQDHAVKCLDEVNGEILNLIHATWGRRG